jgi:hypothetical protein
MFFPMLSRKILELISLPLRHFDNLRWKFDKLGNMNTETLVTDA